MLESAWWQLWKLITVCFFEFVLPTRIIKIVNTLRFARWWSDFSVCLFFTLNLWLMRWHLQDLTIKPKYLVTFTVGFNQKKNIDAAIKKVSSVSLSLFPLLLSCSLFHEISFLDSSQKILLFCCFTMMVGQVNGKSLSGQSEPSTWVHGSKLNG